MYRWQPDKTSKDKIYFFFFFAPFCGDCYGEQTCRKYPKLPVAVSCNRGSNNQSKDCETVVLSTDLLYHSLKQQSDSLCFLFIISKPSVIAKLNLLLNNIFHIMDNNLNRLDLGENGFLFD